MVSHSGIEGLNLKLSIDLSSSLFLDIASPSALCTSSPNSSSSVMGDSTSSADESESSMYQALCLYDFESDDPDHLPFSKNEILTIVKREASGWWAALRPTENCVGWIPSAFVELLSDEMAERLVGIQQELRVIEYDTNDEVDLARIDDGSSQLPLSGSHQEDWMPKLKSMTTTEIVSKCASADSGSRSDCSSLDSFFSDTDDESSPTTVTIRRPPPSPLTPMPQPPIPKSAGSLVVDRPRHSLVSDDFANKHGRSRSDSSSMYNSRHHRRQPLLVQDRTSLSCLSTLIGSIKLEDVDTLTSPDVHKSFEALALMTLQQMEIDAVDNGNNGMVNNMEQNSNATAIVPVPVSACPSRPAYIHPSSDLRFDADGNVEAGTLRALVERLTADSSRQMTFRHTFLLTFRTFTSPERLFGMLVERYDMRSSNNLSPQQLEEWREKTLRPAQGRVLTILTMWLEDYRLLDEEPYMATKFTNFLSGIVMPSHLQLIAQLILKSLQRLSLAHDSASSRSAKKSRKHWSNKGDLLRWAPEDLAEQLCLLDHEFYSRIRPQECLNWAKSESGGDIANIITSCNMHEQLIAWVKTSILSCDFLAKRAEIIIFWLKAAERCENLLNFNSTTAVIAALSSPAIARLTTTWSHPVVKGHYTALARLMELPSHLSKHRSVLQSIDGPCVPVFQLFLTEVALIQREFSDNLCFESPKGEIPLISWTKRQKWYDVISAMLRHQSRGYAFPLNASARSFIESQLQSAGTKSECWFSSRSQEIQSLELASLDIRKELEAAGF